MLHVPVLYCEVVGIKCECGVATLQQRVQHPVTKGCELQTVDSCRGGMASRACLHAAVPNAKRHVGSRAMRIQVHQTSLRCVDSRLFPILLLACLAFALHLNTPGVAMTLTPTRCTSRLSRKTGTLPLPEDSNHHSHICLVEHIEQNIRKAVSKHTRCCRSTVWCSYLVEQGSLHTRLQIAEFSE